MTRNERRKRDVMIDNIIRAVAAGHRRCYGETEEMMLFRRIWKAAQKAVETSNAYRRR